MMRRFSPKISTHLLLAILVRSSFSLALFTNTHSSGLMPPSITTASIGAAMPCGKPNEKDGSEDQD